MLKSAGGDNYRALVQRFQECGATVLFDQGTPTPATFSFLDAMRVEGYEPTILTDATWYADAVKAANIDGLTEDINVTMQFQPFENADAVQAVADYLAVLGSVEDSATGLLGMQSTSAFLLWATAAKACGADLTRQCMVDELSSVTSWTGGGLHAESNPGENLPPNCTLLMALHGGTYEQVAPATQGDFYCADSYLETPESSWGVELDEDRIATTYLTDDVIVPESLTRPDSLQRRGSPGGRLRHLHDPRSGSRGGLRDRGVGPGPDLHHVGDLQLRPRRAGDARRVPYWQLTVPWGLPAPVAFAIVVGVIGPLLGMGLYQVLMKGLRDVEEVTKVIVTVSVLLALVSLSIWIWEPAEPRTIALVFGNANSVDIGGTVVRYGEIFVVLAAVALAIGLRLLFTRTRLGVAMRGVVDDPDLLRLNGFNPQRIAMTSWAFGSALRPCSPARSSRRSRAARSRPPP